MTPWLFLAASLLALDPEARIDARSALERIKFLSSDALEGRGSGSAGGKKAGAYIVAELEAMGLRPRFQPFTVGRQEFRNVVVRIDGAERPEEHVVLGAHYDHVGFGDAGSPLDGAGAIHNGADDNASGSAALLEIAEALAAGGPRARSVVLVWFDAEERGLFGAKHYTTDPELPLERCVAMLNFDMVGRARGCSVQVIGANSGTGLYDRALAAAPEVGIDVDVVPYMVPNSDHFCFYSRRVPVAFFCTGLHEDYHRASDDWEKIDAAGVARVARLGYRLATALADEPVTVEFAAVPSAPVGVLALEYLEGLTGDDAWDDLGRSLYGPIAGAFVEWGLRLRVHYVVPGSPAARAGVRPGDIVLRAGGREVWGPLARRGLARAVEGARRRGADLPLTVRRGGERVDLALPLGDTADASRRVF